MDITSAMTTLTEKYRGSEDLLAMDILYIVFVELVILANILICLRCVKQWRRLREHVVILACLGAGDIYILLTSLWVNINRVLDGSLVTVCDTWSTQYSKWLMRLPLVDAAGVMLLTVFIVYRSRSLTLCHVTSIIVLALPWTISLALVLSLSLLMGIDTSICENFTYDRYMGFNASKLIYILTVIVPIISGLVVFLLAFCSRRKSRQHQHINMLNTTECEKPSTQSFNFSGKQHNSNQTKVPVFSPQLNGYPSSQVDSPAFVPDWVTKCTFIYICLVVTIPMSLINISTAFPQLQETFARHDVDMFKLVKDTYLWVYYLRMSVTPIVWIVYINS